MRFILFVLLMCFFASKSGAQSTVKIDKAGNYHQTRDSVSSVTGQKIGVKFYALDGNSYDVWESKKGKRYYIRTSKQGKEYKVYIKAN